MLGFEHKSAMRGLLGCVVVVVGGGGGPSERKKKFKSSKKIKLKYLI